MPRDTITVYAPLPTGRLVRLRKMTVGDVRAARIAAGKDAVSTFDLTFVHELDQQIKRTLIGITKEPVPWVVDAAGLADTAAMRKKADEAGLWMPLDWIQLSAMKDGQPADTNMDVLLEVDEYEELRRLMRIMYSPNVEAQKKLGEGRLVEVSS